MTGRLCSWNKVRWMTSGTWVGCQVWPGGSCCPLRLWSISPHCPPPHTATPSPPQTPQSAPHILTPTTICSGTPSLQLPAGVLTTCVIFFLFPTHFISLTAVVVICVVVRGFAVSNCSCCRGFFSVICWFIIRWFTLMSCSTTKGLRVILWSLNAYF